MHEELETILSSRKNDRLVYVPNVGNAGDSFIAVATYQLFNRLGLRYEIGSLSGTYPGSIVVCAGGGNLVSLYPHMIDFIRRNQGTWRELIILPHTIRSYAEELGNFRQNCFVFCREKPSYDFVKRCAPNANTFLSHDLAFSSDLDEIRNQKPDLRPRSVGDFLRQLRSQARYQMQLAHAARARTQPDVLNAFRVDVEKTAIEIPADNVDISSALAGNAMLPIPALLATRRMMQMISNFRAIRTNRLHVAIMAAMLGREVHFYDNSYGKNYDVFVHSMQDRFNNVHWHAS